MSEKKKKDKYIVIFPDNDSADQTIKFYSSLRDIQKDTGIHYSAISRYLRKKTYKSIGNKNPGRKPNNDPSIKKGLVIKKIIN